MSSLSRRTFLTIAPMLVALPNIAYASERNHGDLLGPASIQPLPSMETNLLPLNLREFVSIPVTLGIIITPSVTIFPSSHPTLTLKWDPEYYEYAQLPEFLEDEPPSNLKNPMSDSEYIRTSGALDLARGSAEITIRDILRVGHSYRFIYAYARPPQSALLTPGYSRAIPDISHVSLALEDHPIIKIDMSEPAIFETAPWSAQLGVTWRHINLDHYVFEQDIPHQTMVIPTSLTVTSGGPGSVPDGSFVRVSYDASAFEGIEILDCHIIPPMVSDSGLAQDTGQIYAYSQQSKFPVTLQQQNVESEYRIIFGSSIPAGSYIRIELGVIYKGVLITASTSLNRINLPSMGMSYDPWFFSVESGVEASNNLAVHIPIADDSIESS